MVGKSVRHFLPESIINIDFAYFYSKFICNEQQRHNYEFKIKFVNLNIKNVKFKTLQNMFLCEINSHVALLHSLVHINIFSLLSSSW